MRALRVGLLLAMAIAVAVIARAAGGAPEIGVIIAAARGFIPITGEPKVFDIEVLAADPENAKGLLIATDVLVKAGETKKIDTVKGQFRLTGTVTLADEHSVSYRVSLYRGADRIASTASSFGPKSEAIMLELR